MTVEVIKPGLLATLQDAGRPGFAHLGVGCAGAFDAPALRIANALCGNPHDACALELTLSGPTLRFHSDAWLAVTGAPVPLRIDAGEAPMWAPVPVRAGAMLTFGAMRSGCRAYLAVRGGFDVAPVLGSRSVDVNAALGPLGGSSLRSGDILPIAGPADPELQSGRGFPNWRLDPRPWFSDAPTRQVRMVPTPYFDRLTNKSRKQLFANDYAVDPQSNRVGVRLTGPTLDWSAPIEMVSEGSVPGLVQLPPSGQPIALGPESPVSGGYPHIGHVAAVDFPRLAQCRPGDAVRFRACTLDEAMQALQRRERALQKLEGAIATRLQARPR